MDTLRYYQITTVPFSFMHRSYSALWKSQSSKGELDKRCQICQSTQTIRWIWVKDHKIRCLWHSFHWGKHHPCLWSDTPVCISPWRGVYWVRHAWQSIRPGISLSALLCYRNTLCLLSLREKALWPLRYISTKQGPTASSGQGTQWYPGHLKSRSRTNPAPRHCQTCSNDITDTGSRMQMKRQNHIIWASCK